jgi:hypothetical protein
VLTTRRTTLGGALLGLTSAGCSLDRPQDPAGRAAGTPTGSASAQAGRDGETGQDPDAALVDDVLAELRSLGDLTVAVARRFPRLRPEAAALTDLHRAHREALGDEVAAGTGGPGPRSLRRLDAGAARRLLRASEVRAQRRLVDAALAAESGALARLLASMSAGIAQQVAVLPPARVAGAGR